MTDTHTSPGASAGSGPDPFKELDRKIAGNGAVHDDPGQTNLPIIHCDGGKLSENATDAEAALISAGVPFYSRAARIVMPIVEEVDAAAGGKTKVARVKNVDEACLSDRLDRIAVFARFDKRSNRNVRINPPGYVGRTILSRDGEWTFPPLAGVITTPTIRRNGTLLSTPGYDPESKLLLMDPPKLPNLPERPTRADAEAAFDLLNALLDEFPFVDDASRAVALSMLMTPIIRPAIGAAPLHASTAPAPGTGKSYLAELAFGIATGQMAPAMPAGKDEQEMEKRLTAAVLQARPLIAIDNVNGEIGGDLLCQLVERPVVSVRPFGQNTMLVDVPACATVFVNGNNLLPTGDIVRRTIMAQLDANVERPEKRTFRGSPLEAIMADRGRYIAAALIIPRAFYYAGRPVKPPPLASYGNWTNLVRAPLMWLGAADPVDTQEFMREQDPATAAFAALMTELAPLIGPGNSPKRTGEIRDMAQERRSGTYGEGVSYVRPDLRTALLNVAEIRGEIDARRLGRFLARNAGKVHGGMKLAQTLDTDAKVALWSIRDV